MSQSPEERIPEDEDNVEAPLTMAASVLLSNLPKDTSKALETAGTLSVEKVKIQLQPISGAPQLKQKIYWIPTNRRFDFVVRQTRKKLAVPDHESIFCYIGSVFSPALDESVGNLWRCFKQQNDILVVHYALSPSFG